MSMQTDEPGMDHAELASLYALDALPAAERAAAEAHIAGCLECARELEALRPVIGALAAWPTDVVRPAPGLWDSLAQRVGAEQRAADEARPANLARQLAPRWQEPDWDEVAPGIRVKMLATDEETHQVSMLVHLDPGVDYPPHTHAGYEELHLLDGELWIDERKLYPGDFNRAEPGTADKRVWSETGCTCVLITSHRDQLG